MSPKETKKNISRPHPVAVPRQPLRTCVACRQVKAKRELVRLVRTPGGEIEIDATAKKPGRGAYICPTQKCLEKALQGKQLEHFIKGRLTGANREQIRRSGRELLKEPGGQNR
jgi:predicted RNA-binding protein YlxR (DUF448 family)